jgi:hypothetical protein
LSDDVGVIQHAVEDIPNRSTGYCTDDVARAFIVALARLRLVPDDKNAERIASTSLSFLHDAQLEDGRFHNFMSHARAWLDEVGTPDSIGRAIWALGYGMRYAPKDSWRRQCARMVERALGAIGGLHYLRSKAYASLGLTHALAAVPDFHAARVAVTEIASDLREAYLATRGENWDWFEGQMTYDNARLPEALIRIGTALHDDESIAIGLRSFAFYTKVTVENGIYVPIGSDGWYVRGGPRARYAQQPLEATALIDAAHAAFDATGDPAYAALARVGLEWFYGRNSRTMLLARGGGCCDGLDESGVNLNMGAESTLAFLAGAYALADREPAALRVAR